MSSTANFIVSGVLSDGTPIVFGAVPSDGTSHPAIHHVSSASQFQAESWDGEHAENEHHDHEEPRRFSIYLEEGGAEKSGLAQDQEDDEDEPIASSKQFERTRSASLAAALLELDPRGVPLVQFFKLATNEPLLEVDEGEDEVAPSEAELVLSQLLFTLRSLKMSSAGDAKHSEAVQRLRELEEELRAAGAVTPADPAVSEAVARALAVAGAGRDVQIRVNQSKHTTTTKTVYETETSAMAHMDVDQIRKLQQDIIADISSGAEQHSGQDSGTTQKKETAEEGFTNEDGSVVVSKKMTRVVTTTRTTLPGEGEEPSAPDSPVESLGSVKDRIAKFEQFKTLPIDPSVAGPPPSVHAVAREDDEEPEQETREEVAQSSEGRDSERSGHSEQSIPEVQFTESDTEIEKRDDEHHEESYLEPAVGIVITPHTPVPPEHPDDVEEVEDEQPQEPLELSEPEHVAHAEIKDTREYSDEELSHELSPSEEHVSTAEIKDIKSYSPTSSDDERASQKGKVSPPIPQVRHVISPSVASEMSSHDDELAAHFVAESFEKQDEGRVETIEQTPIYRGHHSPGQTSPIVSEHPIAQEYAESVTSHDEGDNLSLKSGHEPEIARHSVASVREEEEEKSGLGDYAKKAGMIVGGVIAAPVALAAVGAKAAYDALKKDSDDEGEQQEVHEEPEVLTTQTTIMESPIQHEDIPPPHLEDVTPKVSHHEHPHETVTETTTTVTREYYDEPESPVRESPVPSEKEPKPHVVSETVTTTTVTREYHEEEVPSKSHAPAPSSHVESEHRLAESPVMSEKEHPQVVETTTTTTYVTRKHDEEDQESESPESVKEAPHVTETTTTTTVTREYDQPEEEFDSERLSEPAHSPEPIGTPAEITREFYDDQDEPEHRDASPVHAEQQFEQEESATAGSPIPSERFVQQSESPVAERHSPVPSEPISEKDAHHVTETTTTTTVTREYYEDEPENHSPAPSSHIDSEHHIAESPAVSEKELPHVVETTTTTTVTREYEEDPETETTPAAAYEFGDDEYERPESPAEVYPIPSEKEQEPHLVSEATATTTVTREYYDEPEHEEIHAESHSPSPSSHVESERQQSPSEKEHVVETTTTTTVTREFHDDQYDRPESPEAHSPSPYAAAGSPIPPEKDAHHVTETTTTTTVTREYYEDEQENHSPAPSSHVESEHQIAESPAVTEKEIPHTLEKTTTTSVTRADDYERPESQPSQPSHRAPESPVVSERHQFQQESAVYHSQTETSQQQYQPESGDESHGEGIGSKVLGFAKKAGMVAGGVVAAPVALAAVGAKAAYDALKKDSDEEGENEEKIQERHEESFSPSTHAELEHKAPESPSESEKERSNIIETATRDFDYEEASDLEKDSPVPSEKDHEHHLVTETTTTTTVTREYHDEPEHEEEHKEFQQEPSYSPTPSSHVESERHLAESPVLSKKEHPHVVETTTTTTITREIHDEDYERPESPSSQRDHSTALSAEVDTENRDVESPATSERDIPHVVETTTTTTVTRELYDEEKPEDVESSVVHDQEDHHHSESPARSVERSEPNSPHVTETITTTTVNREYDEPEEGFDSERLSEPAHSPELVGTAAESEKSIPHVVETTTTTTVTREFYDDQEEPEHRDVSPVHSEQPFEQDETSAAGSPIPSERSIKQPDSPVAERHSSVPSEPISEKDAHHVTETTTTTTVTREYYEDEPENHSPAPSSHVESEHQIAESPAVSEKELPHVVETTTTTTVTREYEEDPETETTPAAAYEFGDDEYERPESPAEVYPIPSEKGQEPHLVSETTTTTTVNREYYDEPEHEEIHRPVPESPVASEKEFPSETKLTQDSPAAQYFHEQPEHQTESPIQTEQAPLLSEQQQPESGDESDGEGFGSKVLGFAKKAGMVAGGVVAAPVALAAVGAKAAYDALKKDSDDEGEIEEPKHIQESSVETSTTAEHDAETIPASVVREHFGDLPKETEETMEEEHPEQAEDQTEASDDSETTTSVSREIHEGEPHLIETTTTTTVTREYHDQPEEVEESDVKETTTTTTVTREYYEVEPESPTDKNSEDNDRDSPVESEKSVPHVMETTTTTTMSREFIREEDPRLEQIEHHRESPLGQDHDDLQRSESPARSVEGSEKHSPYVTETTTTTTVTREYDEPEEGFDSERLSEPAHSPEPIGAPAESEISTHHVVETTTTTTITRELYDNQEEPEHRDASPVHAEQPFEQDEAAVAGSPIPSERFVQQSESPVAERHSPVPSEPISEKDAHHVTETTTTTTVTREYYEDEPENHSSAPSSHVESEHQIAESPAVSEKELPHVVETTTTTTVTREYEEEEPEHPQEHPVESYSPVLPSHELEHRPVPESPVASEKEFTSETKLTRDSPPAQYFHEEPEHQTESPIPTEQAPLLSEQQQQPESGDESDGEGFGSKVLGFAKKAGMVAGGVVAAPVALAAVGAKAAYDALKKESDEEDQEEHEALLGDVREQRSAGSPLRSEVQYEQFHEQRFGKSPETSEKPIAQEFPESPVKSQPVHEEDRESLKSPTESEKSFRQTVEATATTTHQQFEDDSTPASPSHSHKEDIRQFQDEQSPELSGRESEKEHEHEPETEAQLEREGSYSPRYSPKSPRGSLAESDYESRPVKEEVVAEEQLKPEEESEKQAASPVPSEEGSTKFIETTTTTTVTEERYEPEESHSPTHDQEGPQSPVPSEEDVHGYVKTTTTTTTVTREHFEPEDEPTEEHIVGPEEYQTGSPVPSENDSQRIVETTTTTTVTREHLEPEDEPSHVVESQQYSPSRSPVPSEKSEGHVIETTTTTTVTREHVEPEEHDYSGEQSPVGAAQQFETHSPVPSEEDIHGYVKTTTTTTTVTREHVEREDDQERVIQSEEYAAESPVPSDTDSQRNIETTTTTTVTREQFDRESPIQSEQQFEDYQHQYSEEPAIPPYQQPAEYGRVDSHDAPASPAPSVESPVRTSGFDHPEDSERLSEPAQSPEVHDTEQGYHHDEPRFTETSLTQDSPAVQYFHEQPEYQTKSPIQTDRAPLLSEQQQPESGDESDGEGFGSKVLGFAKKAGMVAGGVVAAPVALAAVGAKAAYDALKKDSDEEDEEEQEALLGDVREQRSAGSPLRSEVQYEQFHEQRLGESPEPSEKLAEETTTEEAQPVHPVSDEESASDIEPSHPEADSEQSHHYTETIRKTTVTREYLDDNETRALESHAESEQPVLKSPTEQVVETTTTVIRHYHDEPKPEEESEEKTTPEEVTVLREVYEAPDGDEPEHHYIETKTTTTITKEVYEPESSEVPELPIDSEQQFSVGETRFEEPNSGDTTITTVTRELYEEPEGVRPPSGSEADDESYAPRYLETTTTTTVTREYEVSEDDEEGGQSAAEQQREGSPTPSEDSVTRVVEKTTTTVTEERYEPEESHSPAHSHDQEGPQSPVPSEEDVHGYLKTTTTTTTVTREHFEQEDEPTEEQFVESEKYPAEYPAPSESDSHKIIETTTTTTVTREQFEPEDEPSHVVESQQYSPCKSPVPSEKSEGHVIETTTTTTVTREHVEPEEHDYSGEQSPVGAAQQFETHSPVPSEEDIHGYVKTTTTMTTVTREHVESEDDQEHVIRSEEYAAESPVPSESDSQRIIETTTTTTVTREHFEPEDEPSHVVESQQYSPSRSPVPSEKSTGYVTEATTTTNVAHQPEEPEYHHDEPRFTETSMTQDSPAAHYFHEQPEHQTESPIQTEQAPLLSEQQPPESGDESDGEGFGSNVLGFAKKAGMVAGGVVAAPVALAAVGAKAAYDALKKDSDEEDQEEQEALLGDVRERRAVDSETQEPAATFYEPEEEDKVPTSSPKEQEPKIVFPADSPADQYVQEKQAFESEVQAEGPFIIESEDYEQSVQQEQRISSPAHSDSGDVQTTPQRDPETEEEETPRLAENPESDAPYVIDSEEYEFNSREEQRIQSPAHSDDEEPEAYGAEDQNNEQEDPSIVESEEYTGSGQASPRPFEESTTTTVISVHHEPAAITELEVDEKELEQDRSIIESGEYSSEDPLPPTSISNVEHVKTSQEEEYTPEYPTTVESVISDSFEYRQDPSDPFVVESEEYTRSSPIGYERPESPSGTPVQPQEDEDSHVIESQRYTGSPVPSEESVQHVVEKITTTTTTEEHFEPEESNVDVQEYVKTTTTTTTVTQEHFEPEKEKHVVESEDYGKESSVPSDEGSGRVIETTTTTTVTREHIEPEDEISHVVESQQYSPSGSPVPSEKSEGHVIKTTTTTTVTREHVEPEDQPTEEHLVESQGYSGPGSPIPSEKSVEHVIETTTTTTVTREHVEHEDDFGPVHTELEQEERTHSPIPPEEGVHGFIKTTTTTTTVTREHFEPEDEPSHVVESQQHSPSGSPVPSEKSTGHVIETTTTTTEPEEEERRFSAAPSEGEVYESIKTTSAITSESHADREHYHKEDSGEESDGEGFGSKVLGFAKKAGMVAGGVVAAPVALAAVGAKAAYDALKKDSDDEGEHEQVHYESAELKKEVPSIQTHQDESEGDSDGSFVDHGEDSQRLPSQSTEAAFNLSTEDVAEQTAEKLVSEVFSPLDRTLIESEQYRASIESLNRRSPVQKKRSVEDLASEALQNVTKISFGHADESDDKHDDDQDEEWKVYDRHGEILEEFSTQLTDDVIQEAEGDATTQIMMTQAEYSPRRSKFLKQESCQEISNEPEVDYYSDLQEKLNILAGEKNNLHALVEEEPSSSASDQLDVIHESDQEAHLEKEEQLEAAAQKAQEEKEEAAEITATNLVEEVLQQVVHEIKEDDDDQRTMTSDAYLTATEKDDQEYDTCVTSQDDTYESAQGWTSQDSYTTATSQAPSRLSDSEGEHTARDLERQETSTPQAMISPVDSDRQFTAQQDFEMPVIKAFDADDFLQTTARSTPDVALQVTIEEEDESDDKLPISPSGILLPPKHDPGRPISPVPPRKSDATMQKEGDHFVFVREEDTIAEPTPPPQQYHDDEPVRKTPDETLTQITTEAVPQLEEETEMRRQETERIHSLAMEASSDLGNSESSRYSRQLSDLSSSAESHADTVIRVESERSGSSDSLEVVSVISAGKDAQTSEKSLTPEEPEKPVQEEQKEHHEDDHPHQEAEDLGFEVYDADTEEQEPQQSLEELETVEEEPEDSDSLNEGGNHSSGHSSVGVPADTLAMIGKYRHQSSDNLSLTSLQEFERLEREVGARGDGSLTRSEIELLVAGRLNKSGEGSVSSLAEFERLEKEMTENQSPPEDVMMLSDIREESEAEDMSTRGDDEEDIGGSDTELKSRPVQDEDLRVVTPVAPSPTDSLEHALDPVQMQYLETSTDSLEPTFQEIEVEQRPDSVEDTSLTEYEMVPRVMEASTTDSLDGTATIEKDSVLEGASQGIESTQSTHGLLSGDTMGTVVTDDDRDSLDGEVSSMLQSYPTTLTTFQTTVVGPDGSLQTISRRVETRVTDPLVSHVTFTGTESQERLDQLPDDEQFETVDTEGNVTRTTFHREHDQQHPQF
ncbi:hypothetical protein L5515_010928 [Caenorhabditis briggsae]|uniref:Uncharacterized protein n=2 Tax=Caenorhabditis briggsae TaxID=6238 RepID=A0AAE9ENG6_CAEBR|nr:hypothetical protein L5515_010928 [Caenorhabditis briggsae]